MSPLKAESFLNLVGKGEVREIGSLTLTYCCWLEDGGYPVQWQESCLQKPGAIPGWQQGRKKRILPVMELNSANNLDEPERWFFPTASREEPISAKTLISTLWDRTIWVYPDLCPTGLWNNKWGLSDWTVKQQKTTNTEILWIVLFGGGIYKRHLLYQLEFFGLQITK